MNRIVIFDCEGPISTNDNAYELAAEFVPNGDRFFTVISRYDDVLADFLRRPGYRPGSTLKFILPILKAYGVTDKVMQDFSSRNLCLLPDAKKTLAYIRKACDTFIISTSYEHYIKALCEATDFPFENTYCTRVSIDRYAIPEEEKKKLVQIAEEIAQMTVIKIPPNARSICDFSGEEQQIIQRLDSIFQKEIAQMKTGRIYSEVTPVGGTGKAEAVRDAAQRLHKPLSDVMYIGDSITDEEGFKLVRQNNGLAVSFNGNQYAVRNSEIAVLSRTTLVTAVIVDAFCRNAKSGVLRLAENWSLQSLEESEVNHILMEDLNRLKAGSLPKVKLVTPENMESLSKESSEFRKEVRGEAIGGLA